MNVPSAPHVLVAINGVMGDIAQEGIAKDRKNEAQNYKFRGIDDVYNAMCPLFAKHKLIVIPHGLNRSREERATKNGGVMAFVTVEVEFALMSAVDGSSVKSGPFYGEAMDSGDKATNKAQSAAFKYMAMEQFCIPTEGDNDADAHAHELAARDRPPPVKVLNPKTGRMIDPMSPNQARQDGRGARYDKLQHEITDLMEVSECIAWGAANKAEIETMPANWRDDLRAKLTLQMQELRGAAETAFRHGDSEALAGHDVQMADA